MLPFTTKFAPKSFSADEGSVTFRPRTTLDGTTHNDCCAASRFESLLVNESINPSATASFAGSFPRLSNGSTATCFSPLVPESKFAARCRTGGNNNEPAVNTNAASAAKKYGAIARCFGLLATAAAAAAACHRG